MSEPKTVAEQMRRFDHREALKRLDRTRAEFYRRADVLAQIFEEMPELFQPATPYIN
jgi:hypothetical protein